MKSLILVLLAALSLNVMAEDSVVCDDAKEVNIALTDDDTVLVHSFKRNEQLVSLQVLVRGESAYRRIENDKTKMTGVRIDSVKVTIDNGTSIRRVVIFDLTKFEDGAEMPVKIYDQSPTGEEYRETIMCYGAQS